MDIQAAAKKIRNLTYSSTANMPDPELLTYIDQAHKRVYDEILMLNENMLVAQQIIPLVAYQAEYPLTTPTSTVQGIEKIVRIGIKYDDTIYTQRQANTPYSQNEIVFYNGATYVAKTDMLGAVSFQTASFQEILVDYKRVIQTNFSEENANTGNQMDNIMKPRYIRYSNTIKLTKIPDKSVQKGLVLYYIPTCIDITNINGAESLFQVPREQHDVICKVARADVFRYQNKQAEAANADAEAAIALENMKRKIRMRDYSTMEEEMPDLHHLGR